MKRTLSILLLTLVAIAALAVEVLSPSDLLKASDKYDGKVVTVKAKVSSFKQKTSKAGNPYFTFEFQTNVKDEVVHVYGRGTADKAIKDGAEVEATGTFRKEKKIQNFTVKDEIDVTPTTDKKVGIKVVKAVAGG